MSSPLLAAISWAFLCLAVTVVPVAAQNQQQKSKPQNADMAAPTVPAQPAVQPAPATAVPDSAADVAAPNDGAPTAAPAPVVSMPPGDVNVAQKLQDLIGTRLPEFFPRKPEREAVEAFYRERGYQPLWVSNGAATPRAAQVAEYLKTVGADGLDPSDYPVPSFSGLDDQDAANELKLTRSLLTYGRHASSGRVSYTRVSGSVLYPPNAIAPADVLARVAASGGIAATLASFEPQHPQYKALKAALATARAAAQDAPAHRGEKRPRIGTVDLIEANMERWRWVPRDLGVNHVIVDVPAFSLSVYSHGKEVWRTKIVDGQPNKSTPLLSETMKYITVNPIWNVPPSIIRNEYLPALERDPDALDRIGLRVGRNRDGSLRVYQPPGARNALGRIRFNFPNVFLVYQHDTPNKNLFARENRALSHGCMRVQYPEKYAEVLLSLSQPEDGYTAKRIDTMYGDQERTIRFKSPIWVHITYQTAYVDGDGHLKTREDIYGLDADLLKVMHGKDRSIADTPIARNYQSSSKPVMARLPERSDSRASAYNNEGWDRDNQWGWDNRDWGMQGYSGDHWDNQSYGRRAGQPDRAVGQW
jgi:murein L,D-transpeptidase YcbB/YkuD